MRHLLVATALAALPVIFAGTAQAGPDAATLVGVYKHLQSPSTEDGVTSRDEDILEIIPYAGTKDKAYFRLFMRFANYHACDAFGIARTTATGLLYEASVHGMGCKLKIDFTPKGLEIQDNDDLCRMVFCGARGSLNWTSPIRRSDRRTIRYNNRILESDEYAKAIEIEKGVTGGKLPAAP